MYGKKSRQPIPESAGVRPLSTKPPKISAEQRPEPKPESCRETSLDFIRELNRKGRFQQLPPPIKSPEDKKHYKVIRLANGLTACLISDPSDLNNDEDSSGYETNESGTDNEMSNESCNDCSEDEQKAPTAQKMAAAALCVGVGYFSDPKDIPGMAHFLEHMVFMGSTKFPEENGFDNFTKSRGGSSNGTTDVETTNFYFECLNKHMYKALDRFAQFFISPLMLRDSITREREAIDSEFQEALPIDEYRKEQLLLGLTKRDSPVNPFLWGNLKTLRDNIKDSKLYKALHEFRKRHYSAHRMTLAIQAALPIELLEAYVLDCFSNVPCNDKPPFDFTMLKDCYDTPKWNRIYFVEPTEDVDVVEITFVLPSLFDKYKTKPDYYVSEILGDEGKGSLMSYLRKKVWVLDIVTGNSEYGTDHNSLYTFFSIYMHLTAEGLQNLYTIIELVFSFINMLKTVGPQESIYNEMKQIKANKFRFPAEQSAYENVENIAKNMHIYPSEDYLTGPELFYEYDPEGIKMVMDHLVPSKANIIVNTKNHLTLDPPVQYDKVEEWFGTKYTDVAITEERLLRWETARPLEEFALPLPNQFLTVNFDMLPPSSNDTHPEVPVKILKNDAIEVWHRKDEKFGLPMAIWYIHLVIPWAVKTKKRRAMLDLYVSLMAIQIAEEARPARNADLSLKLKASEKGLMIRVRGFNEKLPILIDLLLKYLKSFNSILTNERFAAVKANETREFHNKLLDPEELANYEFKVIAEITFENMKTFAERLLEQLYVKVLVQGNVSAEQVSLVAQNVVGHLNFKSIPRDDVPKKNTLQVPLGRTVSRVPSQNKSDSNSSVVNYYQGENAFDMNTNMVLAMTELLIEEPLYDTLRTKEQLGYSVSCTICETDGILGISVTVNMSANKYSVDYVDKRIDAFMKQALQLLRDTSEAEFNNAKDNLIKKKQCCDNSLAEEAARNWTEIMDDLYNFDRIKQEVKCLEKLKHSDLVNWWKKNIYCDVENKFTYRMTTTQVAGYGSKETSTQKSDDEVETQPFTHDSITITDGDSRTHIITDLENVEETCSEFLKKKCTFYMNYIIKLFRR